MMVMLTEVGADVPTPFVAVTWKVAVVAAETGGAVQVTLAAAGGAGLNVPVGPAVWLQLKVIGVAPLAAAFRITLPFEAT